VRVGSADDRGLFAPRSGVLLGEAVGDNGYRDAVGLPLGDVVVTLRHVRNFELVGPVGDRPAVGRGAEQERSGLSHALGVVIGERARSGRRQEEWEEVTMAK
jgi:hypothetical protein